MFCTSVKFLSVTKMVLLCIGRSDSACAYWQEKGFSGHNAYSVSKLANLMFSNELAPLMKQQGVTVNCVHPGIIATNVLHDGWGGGGSDAKVQLAFAPGAACLLAHMS